MSFLPASFVEKIALLMSIVFFGYNFSMFLNRYSFFCRKALGYKELIRVGESDLILLRRMNIIFLCILWLVYTYMLRYSGFSFAFCAIISLKFLLSLYYSDKYQCCVVKDKSISKSLYWQIKLDSMVNFCGAIFLSLLLARII